MSEETFMEFGFGQNDDGITNRAKKFKAEKDKVYRIGFAFWPSLEDGKDFTSQNLTLPEGEPEEQLTPKWLGAKRVFIKGAGYVLSKGPEYEQLAGKDAKTYAATIIVIWPLGENNKPTKESLMSKKPQVLPWVISAGKYELLKKMHKQGYPMHEWDINAELDPQSDVTYQDFQFLPAKNCVFKEMLRTAEKGDEKAKEICDYVITRVREISTILGGEIGREMTIDEVKQQLGHEVAGPVVSAISSDEEVDGMLASMLDG